MPAFAGKDTASDVRPDNGWAADVVHLQEINRHRSGYDASLPRRLMLLSRAATC